MSFKSMKNRPHRAAATKLMTLAECWDHFRGEVIPADADPDTVKRARMVFYAGAAFYQDQILRIGDECNAESLSDDAGAERLETLACELDEFAGELAVDLAFKMPKGGRIH